MSGSAKFNVSRYNRPRYNEGTPVTLSPAPLTIPLIFPSLTLIAALSPSPLALPVVVVAPTLTVTVAPSALVIPIVLVAPALTDTLSPAPLTIPLSLSAPALISTISPAPLAIPLSLPAPTLIATISPSPVIIIFVIPDPSIVFGAFIFLDPLVITLALPAPSLIATLSPTPISVIFATPSPSIVGVTAPLGICASLAEQIRALAAFADDQVSVGDYRILNYGHPYLVIVECNEAFRADRETADQETIVTWTARVNLYARYTDDATVNDILRDRRDEIILRLLQNPTLGAVTLDSLPARGGVARPDEVEVGGVVFQHEYIDVEIEELVDA